MNAWLILLGHPSAVCWRERVSPAFLPLTLSCVTTRPLRICNSPARLQSLLLFFTTLQPTSTLWSNGTPDRAGDGGKWGARYYPEGAADLQPRGECSWHHCWLDVIAKGLPGNPSKLAEFQVVPASISSFQQNVFGVSK